MVTRSEARASVASIYEHTPAGSVHKLLLRSRWTMPRLTVKATRSEPWPSSPVGSLQTPESPSFLRLPTMSFGLPFPLVASWLAWARAVGLAAHRRRGGEGPQGLELQPQFMTLCCLWWLHCPQKPPCFGPLQNLTALLSGCPSPSISILITSNALIDC